MNIAIIIGVSKYSDPKNNLPGCKNDAEVIYNIIQKTEKFSNILYINSFETSAKTKELITNFITENRDKQPIDELFFYFSGHGEFINDEFYYILSDFDAKKRKQTTLQNKEMDDLMKALTPNLVIKVIDACQSGTAYIKEINVLTKYFNDSTQIFKKCYFLNSSLNNQSSYQDDSISVFTKSFINSLKNHNSSEIRYKDIMDVISDEFESTDEQTPFFVVQADYTEKFCTFSTQLREYLQSLPLTIGASETGSDKPLSIAELIKLDAKNYVNKEGALEALELIKKSFSSSLKLGGGLDDLFKLEINFLESHRDVPQLGAINKWIKTNKTELFAEPIYEEEYDVFIGGPDNVLVGFDLKVDSSYKAISIDIIANYPNLNNYKCVIVFLLSKRHIRFFYFITNYFLEGWDNLKLNRKDIQWLTTEWNLSDKSEIERAVNAIIVSIQFRIETDLNDKFNIYEGVDNQNTKTE